MPPIQNTQVTGPIGRVAQGFKRRLGYFKQLTAGMVAIAETQHSGAKAKVVTIPHRQQKSLLHQRMNTAKRSRAGDAKGRGQLRQGLLGFLRREDL